MMVYREVPLISMWSIVVYRHEHYVHLQKHSSQNILAFDECYCFRDETEYRTCFSDWQ